MHFSRQFARKDVSSAYGFIRNFHENTRVFIADLWIWKYPAPPLFMAYMVQYQLQPYPYRKGLKITEFISVWLEAESV